MKKIDSFVCLRFLVILLLVAAWPSICFAQQESNIMESERPDDYYRETIINKSFKIISVWTYNIVKDDFQKAMIERFKKDDVEKTKKYKNLDHVKGIWRIDCQNKQSKIEKNIYYDARGKIIDQHIYEDSEWKRILPDTTAEKLYKSVCVTN